MGSCCSILPGTYPSWVPLIYYYCLSFAFPRLSALVALLAQIVLILIDCGRKTCSSATSQIPKHLDCILLTMFLLLLVLSYINENWIENYNPIFIGLFMAGYSLISIMINRPFAAQYYQSVVPEREWKNKTFLSYARWHTILWFILFLLCAASGAAAAGNYEKIEQDHLHVFCKYILPAILFFLGLLADIYNHSKVKKSFKDTDIFSHLDADDTGNPTASSSAYNF